MEQREVGLLQVMKVLRRRVRLLVTCFALGVSVAVLLCLFMQPLYDAKAELNVHPEGSAALDLGDLGDLATGSGGLDWNSKLETQARILRSDTLAWDVIKQLRLDRDPSFSPPQKSLLSRNTPPVLEDIDKIDPVLKHELLRRFSKSLNVQAVPKTQVISIRFRSPDPALAASVVNHLTVAYVQHNFMTRFEATMQASAWLQRRLDDLRANVETSQRKLAEYQKKANIIGSDENNNLAMSQLGDVSKQLSDAEADRIMKEAKYRLAQGGDPELIGTILPDSVLPVLRSQEADLRNQLAQLTARFGANYPRVIQLRNQLAQLDSALKKEIKDIEARFETEYLSAKKTEDQLRASMEARKREAFSQTERFSEYDMLKNQVESGRTLHEDLLRKLNEAGIAAGLKSTNVDVIDPAAVPVKPVLPNVPLFLSLGVFGGAFLGLGLAFVLESVDHTISSPEEVEELCQTPILGVIPHISSRESRRIPVLSRELPVQTGSRTPVAIERPHSKVAEAFRALRTSVLLAAPGSPPKAIVVTSAQPGDGKSTVSENIAAVLAQSGAKVLLVDADLRRGRLAVGLGLSATNGLSEALAGQYRWRDSLVPLPSLPNLCVLAAGQRPPNPADLLTSAQLDALLLEWRTEYDHIIIDTPPVVVVTDAVLLSQRADAVMLIARSSRTGRHPVRMARDLLRKARAGMVGVVINDFEIESQYYGYSYNYNRYYLEEETDSVDAAQK